MTQPVRTTSLIAPVMLRRDLSRDAALAYWAGTHAQIVSKLPNLMEYNQRLFSTTDHGFWPTTYSVGTTIPGNWRLDGCAELRFRSAVGLLKTGLHAREVQLDEQNVFGRVLAHYTSPGGGRWFTDGSDTTVGHHVALLLRRRRGVRGNAFRAFVHQRLTPALLASGARDLRAYTFVPYTAAMGGSPGVAHDNPPQHRYHGAVLFGVAHRDALDDLLGTAAVAAVIAEQHTTLTAVHAYSVQHTAPVVQAGGRSWR